MNPLLLLLLLGGAAAVVMASSEPETADVPTPIFDNAPSSQKDAEARQSFLRTVRPDALHTADGYSRHTYYVQSDGKDGWVLSKAGAPFAMYVDEFGRLVTGMSGDPLGVALKAAGMALPWVPGVGPAAAAALAASIAIAQGKSAEDAALAAARNALPGPAKLAFDVGVAVASGEPVDDAAKEALLDAVPGGRDAYQQGVELYSEVVG